MAVKYADEIIVLSRNVQEYFYKNYNRDTRWIPNGVNKAEPVVAGRISELYGLERESYVLFLGRLVPEKGIHYLLDVWHQTKTDKKLVIAGGASDTDDYLKSLKEQAAGNKNIVFTGFVQGRVLEELYSNAYTYILPSDVEGMPLSLLEAMSYGNCCLVSDIPECAEVVEDKAVVFSAGNRDALRAKLQQLLDEPGIVNEYKKSAQDHVCGKYNWDDVTEKTLELYR